LIRQAAQEKRPLELLLLFSHLHHDHTQGFPFFAPAYMPATRLHIFGPGGTPETVRHVLEQNQSTETFPVSLRDMSSMKEIHSVHDTRVIVWDEAGIRLAAPSARSSEDALVAHVHRSYAHPGGVFAYRLTWCGRSVVYATDIEGYVGTDRRLAAFARQADVLIHDAQYSEQHYRGGLAGFPSTQGYGHSTAAMAGEMAASAEVGELILYHHDPAYSGEWIAAQESVAQKFFPHARAAYEGLEIDLLPEAMVEREVQYVKDG
jgi:ribonuclease BN (tRNA processing enzyme)